MYFEEFLDSSYTAYHAAENAAQILREAGFAELKETNLWNLEDGGAYFVRRGGSLVAFRFHRGAVYTAVAAHTDSPCFKLKRAQLADDNFTRLDTEPYGGGLWYTFFDRPLKIAGRVVRMQDGAPEERLFVSDFDVVIPSVAIHQNRTANEKFAPDLAADFPLLSLGKRDFDDMLGHPLSFDLFAVPDLPSTACGADAELLVSPRLDDLTGVYYAVRALTKAAGTTTQIAALFEAEEIGSRTDGGAGGTLLPWVLERLDCANGFSREEALVCRRNSLLISADNAHALHPNHPETSDPVNRPVPGGGVALKRAANGAYATDAVTCAALRVLLEGNGVPVQDFYNRSDAKSGSTVGPLLSTLLGMPTADMGIPQLAMHSAMETVARRDLSSYLAALTAVFER